MPFCCARQRVHKQQQIGPRLLQAQEESRNTATKTVAASAAAAAASLDLAAAAAATGVAVGTDPGMHCAGVLMCQTHTHAALQGL
jgi:hypothetical protein